MANRFLVAGGNGNWNDNSNWAATDGGASGASFPVAGDVVAFTSLSGNANMTVNVASACASLIMSGTYAGTLTFNSTLTLTSTCTFLSTCTIAGTAGTLIGAGGATYTSGGKTLTCALTFNAANANYTLADNWVVNGLVTLGSTANNQTINGNQITCAAGLTVTSINFTAGTTKIVLTGGTWSNTTTGPLRLNTDLQGNITLSGTVVYNTGTLRYVSGTITTTGSTLSCSAATTLDTAGVTWNNVTLTGSVTHTLTSALAWSGTLTLGNSTNALVISGAALSGTGPVTAGTSGTITLNNTGGLVTTGTLTLPNTACTFAGSAGFTVGTLTTAALTASRTHTLTFGRTYTVTTAISNGATAAARQALVSGTPGSRVVFTVQSGATMQLAYCDPTDIDSSAGGEVVSVGATITNSLNWVGSVVAPTYPDISDVRSGVAYGGGTGTLIVPADADVRLGTGVDDGTGTMAVPIPANVREGVATDATTGTLEIPDEADVRDGVGYGALGSEFTGTLTLPTQSQVEEGVSYGADGSEYIGTLVASGGGGSYVTTNFSSASYTSTAGIVSGLHSATHTLDSSYLSVTSSGGVIDGYLQFNCTGSVKDTGYPSQVNLIGYFYNTAIPRERIDVYGYDWVAAGWVKIGAITGLPESNDRANIFTITDDMIGTGGSAGQVRIRFSATGLTVSSTLAINRAYATTYLAA